MLRCKLTVLLVGHYVWWPFTWHKSEALIVIGFCTCLHDLKHGEKEQLNGEMYPFITYAVTVVVCGLDLCVGMYGESCSS